MNSIYIVTLLALLGLTLCQYSHNYTFNLPFEATDLVLPAKKFSINSYPITFVASDNGGTLRFYSD